MEEEIGDEAVKINKLMKSLTGQIKECGFYLEDCGLY